MTNTIQPIKLIPMLFTTDMAERNATGKKFATRRTQGLEIINQNPDDWQFELADYHSAKWAFTQLSTVNKKSLKDKNFNQVAIKCPFGWPGFDILWQREAFGTVDYANGSGKVILYFKAKEYLIPSRIHWRWKPNMHMPLMYCRFFAKIMKILPYRLHTITEQQAIDEGVSRYHKSPIYGYRDYMYPDQFCQTARESYFTLWDSINGKGSSELNPWVWVIEYEALSMHNLINHQLPGILAGRKPGKDREKIYNNLMQVFNGLPEGK